MASAIEMQAGDYQRLRIIQERFDCALGMQQDPKAEPFMEEIATNTMKEIAKNILDFNIGRTVSLDSLWARGPNARIIAHLQELNLYPSTAAMAATVKAIEPAVRRGIAKGYMILVNRAQANQRAAKPGQQSYPQVNSPKKASAPVSQPQMSQPVIGKVSESQKMDALKNLLESATNSVRQMAGVEQADLYKQWFLNLSESFGKLDSFSDSQFK